MRNQNLTILIIEDHPVVATVYKGAFEKVSEENTELSFKLDSANDCDSAIDKLQKSTSFSSYDIIFLDISLPSSKTTNIHSGEDLGIKIRKDYPNTKIIVSTTYYDNFRIQSIIKSIDPDGFLIKNDFDNQQLKDAILTVINEPPYYSKTVLKSLRKRVANEYIMDEIDRRLLYEISIGTKMKELPNILPLSIAGVEKRKRHLKEIFNLQNKDDRELILQALEKGFI